MNAAMRVNNPTVIRMPRTNSIRPAHQAATCRRGRPAVPSGQPNSFMRAVQRDSSPKMMRKALRTGE